MYSPHSPRGLGGPRINILQYQYPGDGILWVGLVLPYSTKFEICQRIAFLVGVHRVLAQRDAHIRSTQQQLSALRSAPSLEV